MILVTGAKGVVGTPLCEKLDRIELPFMTVSRSKPSSKSAIQWDLEQPLEAHHINNNSTLGFKTLIHCAPIWFLPKHVKALHSLGVTRMVVFSSTSVIGKKNSTDPAERVLVEKLANAEKQLTDSCNDLNINLTILRPTLIYGYGRDQNVTHIASIIKRYKCMLLLGKASGLRQPVHADDLVTTALAIVGNPLTYNKTYNLGGGEQLSYRAMVKRIFDGLERQAIMISIPQWLFRIIIKLASTLSSFAYSTEMASRMNIDLVYDIQNAENDFAYKPQSFLEQPKRDLKEA